MSYRLITDSEIRDLPAAEQFFQYADAYLRAAINQCDIVALPPAHGRWPDATVALLLAAHAVELFLKAAILLRTPNVDPAGAGHDISELNRTFRKLYPEPEFAWEFPFSAVDLDQDVPKAIAYERSMQSMVYRYPLRRKKEPWHQISALEPSTFKGDLLDLQQKFALLQNACRNY